MPIPSLTSPLKFRTKSTKTTPAPLSSTSSRNPPPEPTAPSQTPSVTNSADGARRRSLLPQPGDLKYGLRRGGQDDAAKQPIEERKPRSESISSITGLNATTSPQAVPRPGATARLRPRSMYQTGSTRVEQRPEADDASATRAMPPPARPVRPAVAQPSLLGRTQSLRKPATATPATQSTSTRSHVRTQSITSVPPARKVSVEIKPQRERPKSLFVPPRAVPVVPGKASPDTVVSTTGKSSRLASIQRSASLRPRPRSRGATTSTVSAVSTTSQPENPNLGTSSRSHEPSKEEPPKPNRQAFTTFQQHYTPARKVGKAPTSTFIHPPAPEIVADAISPEKISLQAELLQLHILHQASAEVSRQWELSAKKSLRRQFDDVASSYRVMRAEELHGQEQKNVRALRDWDNGHLACSLAEHIQILSGPLQELPSLVDPEGRFGRLLRDFHKWIGWVEDVSASRQTDGSDENNLASVEGLGDHWKAESAALTRKLTSFSHDFDRLATPAIGSSISSIVATCRDLIDGTLTELQVMQRIEVEIVEREKMWVEAGLKGIARHVGVRLEKDEDCVAWRL